MMQKPGVQGRRRGRYAGDERRSQEALAQKLSRNNHWTAAELRLRQKVSGIEKVTKRQISVLRYSSPGEDPAEWSSRRTTVDSEKKNDPSPRAAQLSRSMAVR